MYNKPKKRLWTKQDSMNLFECVTLKGYDSVRTEMSAWNQLSKELGLLDTTGIEIKRHYYKLLELKNYFDKNILDQSSLKVESQDQSETKEYKKFQMMISDFKKDSEEGSDNISTCSNITFK